MPPPSTPSPSPLSPRGVCYHLTPARCCLPALYCYNAVAPAYRCAWPCSCPLSWTSSCHSRCPGSSSCLVRTPVHMSGPPRTLRTENDKKTKTSQLSMWSECETADSHIIGDRYSLVSTIMLLHVVMELKI